MATATGRQSSQARYVVDTGNCIGCGLCHERAPENVALDDDEKQARILKQPVDGNEAAACEDAADYCPTGGLQRDVSPRAGDG